MNEPVSIGVDDGDELANATVPEPQAAPAAATPAEEKVRKHTSEVLLGAAASGTLGGALNAAAASPPASSAEPTVPPAAPSPPAAPAADTNVSTDAQAAPAAEAKAPIVIDLLAEPKSAASSSTGGAKRGQEGELLTGPAQAAEDTVPPRPPGRSICRGRSPRRTHRPTDGTPVVVTAAPIPCMGAPPIPEPAPTNGTPKMGRSQSAVDITTYRMNRSSIFAMGSPPPKSPPASL